VIYLQTNVENILKRISKDKTRPLIDVEDKKNAIEKIISDRKSYYEEICILKIKTNNVSKNEVVNKILIEYENYKKN
jgi:shikimate kinase